MSDSRFALYLIPPYQLSKNVAEAHALLRKQFGFSAADRFPVHCTIKGFFKKNDLKSADLKNDLDAFFEGQKALPVSVEDFRVDPIGFGLSLLTLDGETNQAFLKFRQELVEITKPYIADDSDFNDHALSHPFHPHITFSFRDIPNDLYDNVFEWMEDGPDFKGPFLADTYHFLEVFSEDWNGSWWESISWRLLASWRLEP
ncbi:MAG: 2'-5' RNA ligase family protein [Anaerolineales bacterium]